LKIVLHIRYHNFVKHLMLNFLLCLSKQTIHVLAVDIAIILFKSVLQLFRVSNGIWQLNFLKLMNRLCGMSSLSSSMDFNHLDIRSYFLGVCLHFKMPLSIMVHNNLLRLCSNKGLLVIEWVYLTCVHFFTVLNIVLLSWVMVQVLSTGLHADVVGSLWGIVGIDSGMRVIAVKSCLHRIIDVHILTLRVESPIVNSFWSWRVVHLVII
jgi:hypothetical protein